MKKTLCYFVFALTILVNRNAVLAQPTDLFISEYVEGSSFNKALEMYNGTSAAIDLTAGQYILEFYFNGATTSSSLALTGTVLAGATYVVAHTSAVLSFTPQLSSGAVNFNGDDAIVLKKGGVSGTVLDVIGQVGFDPGTQWGSNDTCTLDRTIRRKASICQGDVTISNVFFIAPEWDGFPLNTFTGLGSHTVSCTAPPTSTNAGLSVSPVSLSFTTLANVPSATLAYVVTGNTLTAPVTLSASAFFEISLSSSGPFSTSLSIPSASFSPTFTIYVQYVPTTSGSNTGTVEHTSNTYTATLNLSGTALTLTPVYQIQGSSSASSFTNQVVFTEGIVTGDYQATTELAGFYIQDLAGDNNTATSDGIFVSNSSFTVNAGDYVRLTGTVEEYFGRTQIKSVTSLSVQSTGNTITAVTASLPVTSLNDFEKLEGMKVLFTQSLTVSEVYTLARYGEVLLSSGGRLVQPTGFIDPNDAVASGTISTGSSNVTAVTAQQNLNDLNKITLDDKSSVQNPTIVPYVDPINSTLRCGSSLANLQGIMDYAFSLYRIQPLIAPAFTYAARPSVPALGGANVKVASFNVLNYFNGNGSGGGFPTSRGASTATEFSRQRAKIIEAIKQMSCDVVGLMEMENDGDGSQSAIADLVSGLNTSIGSTTYTYVLDPTTTNGGTGTDAIKVALIYKPAVLTCVGLAKSDNNVIHNRPPLAQTFMLNSNSEKFSVVVNHFKSKSCSGSTGLNTDQNDGQGCYNDTRRQQATALLSYITTIVTQSGDNDIIAIGDFNGYEQEDPIDRLIAGGLTHLLNNTYSYVFNGQSGSLDHAFVSQSLGVQVTGADKWHINADEPIAKDYNQEFNPAYMYTADAYRSSDHDPVMVGLYLEPAFTISVAATTSVGCFGNSTGAATISVTGTTSALTYSWLPNGGNTLTAQNLQAGTYTVSVSDGTTTAITTITITQAPALTGSVSSQTSLTCNGSGNATASISANGGTGAYTYSWSPAGGNTASTTSLQAATYTVTIKDANLCTKIQTLTITQPPAITVSLVGSASVSCNGGNNGSATVTANGGTGAFTYSWSPSGGSNPSGSGLQAGTYSVIVKDFNLCSLTQTLTIAQPLAITINLTGSSSVTCNGGSNGSATVTANGGIGALTYSWTTGSTLGSASSITAGIYTVIVKDANACAVSQTMVITEPAIIIANLAGPTNVTCHGLANGSATLNVTGGTGSYTYSWTPTGGTNGSANQLAPGLYTVFVKDANLCNVTKTLTISQPAMIDVSTNVNGATIQANANNSSYQWTNCDNNYSFLAGNTQQFFTATLTGKYAVIVSKDGCSDTSSCVSIILTGLLKNTEFTALSIYPNPVKDILTVIGGNLSQNALITIYSSTGSLVYSSLAKDGKTSIDLSSYTNGIYFMHLQTDGISTIRKVVKID